MGKKERKKIEVDTTGICKDVDYVDYECDFIDIHLPKYIEKYGIDPNFEGMQEYRRVLRKDLKVALVKDKDDRGRWPVSHKLTRAGIMKILRHVNHFKNLLLTPLTPDAVPLAAVYDFNQMMYVDVFKADFLYNQIEALSGGDMTKKQMDDIILVIAASAERVLPRRKETEIPCENYIYDEATGEKIPYGPDVYMLSHGVIDYDPNAENPHFHNPEDGTDWDMDSWLLELFDGDEEMVDLFWQINARLVRPGLPCVGVAMYVGDKGNNGKGSLIHLQRHLVGEGSYASVDFAEFAREYGLNALVRATCILCDENEMNYLFAGNARLKAVLDAMSEFRIGRKYLPDLTMTFPGFAVECVNELPRMADKTDSIYRRIIPIPFNKSYTNVKKNI